MANEAEIINNPDSTPGAVSTGYQLQNTNLVAQRTGIDKTYVRGNGNTVIVEISGPVDVNGVLYTIKSQTVLTPPSAGRYYITLQGAGQYLTPKLGTSAGTFDPLKNARYDSSGYRVLNWVIYFDGTTCYANRLITPESENNYLPDINEPEEVWITANGNWTATRSKYYNIEIIAAGAPGANGQNSGKDVGGNGGNGGGGGAYAKKRIFIQSGTIFTATFGASNTTFSNGTNSIIIGNGSNASSGYDFLVPGTSGTPGAAHSGSFGGAGGAGGKGIIFNGNGGGGGGGGSNSSSTVNGGNGGAGTIYGGGGGGGGGGAYYYSSSTGNTYYGLGGSGGAGGGGFIHIVG